MIKKKLSFKGLSGGEEGSILVITIPLIGLFTIFLTLNGKKLLLLNEERKQRTQTYSCLKATMDNFSSLQDFLKLTNKTILGLNAAMILKPNPMWANLKKAVQLKQKLKVGFVLKRIISKNQCIGLQKHFQYITNPLFKGQFWITRNVSGTARLRKKRSKFTLPSRSILPFLFLIKGEVNFSPSLNISNTKEISLSRRIYF